MYPNSARLFWNKVDEYLKSREIPLSRSDLKIQAIFEDHLNDNRTQGPLRPPPSSHDKYPLARYRLLLKLIDEGQFRYERAASNPRTRAFRANLACVYWIELKDFCFAASDDQFQRVVNREAALRPACVALWVVARALVRIRIAIVLFRCRNTYAHSLAENALMAICGALGSLAPVIEFRTSKLAIPL